MSAQYQIPPTPRVISPSPTPSEQGGKDGYFPPTTRSKASIGSSSSSISSKVDPIQEQHDSDSDPELSRARSRSRSPQLERKPTRQEMKMGMGMMNGSVSTSTMPNAGDTPRRGPKKPESLTMTPRDGKVHADGQTNGFLSPESAYPRGFGSAYWRNLSRSPSPLGLIPIHRDWKKFVHKHEVPRKVLHVSIGFVALALYWEGLQPTDIHPLLLALLIPIFSVDVIRFRWPALNRLYIKLLGGFMRESEAHDRYNGVIAYLAGLWVTMRFCRKDVGIMSVLLLSWCDTAASTFGRLWGKYTPRIRRGKSLAGTLACFVVGVATAVLFWGVVKPRMDDGFDEGVNSFAFEGTLTLPAIAREKLGLGLKEATIDGELALAVLSIITGFVVSASEAIDLWGLDDNLTIPVFCGAGLGAILWACGAS